MEDNYLKESGRSKVLTLEQLQKLQDLQWRREQIKKTQDEGNKNKKKCEKNGSPRPESGSGQQERIPTQNTPDAAPTKGSEPRLRIDLENNSFTPSRGLSIFIARENGEDNSQAEQKFEETKLQEEAVAQQALAKEGGGGGSATSARRKRKKLYWGLDSKERWERKSNM